MRLTQLRIICVVFFLFVIQLVISAVAIGLDVKWYEILTQVFYLMSILLIKMQNVEITKTSIERVMDFIENVGGVGSETESPKDSAMTAIKKHQTMTIHNHIVATPTQMNSPPQSSNSDMVVLTMPPSVCGNTNN